jgi:hypothetical protein
MNGHETARIPPRPHFAPLAVLSLGPRLAGTPTKGKEMSNVWDGKIVPINRGSVSRNGRWPARKFLIFAKSRQRVLRAPKTI